MPKKSKEPIDPEAKAISQIILALDNIAPERKMFILDFVRRRIVTDFNLPASGDIPEEISSTNVGDVKNVKAFLKLKAPTNDYQKSAVLAYYLRRHEQIDEVNAKDIFEANKEALGRLIDNIPSVLNDAKRKYGYFTDGTGGKKRLSAFGEDIVEALPNQERVKELSKKSRKRKRRRKKLKSKS
jgi:hypothetical protein